MKKLFICLFIFFVGVLFANPIVPGPKIVELYRDGNDWQITLFNIGTGEFTLDNCAISTNSGFSEFNYSIEFIDTTTVTNEDLQDSLYIDWESDVIQTYYYDDYSGYSVTDDWSFAPNTYWSNSVNPLYTGQSLREYEIIWLVKILAKYSNQSGSLGMYGFLEGNVYDVNENYIENASVEFYSGANWLEEIFPPAITNDQGFFNTQIYAKNYEVSACINGISYIDTFLTIEPDSTTFINFYTDYDPNSSENSEDLVPVSYYILSNYPNPFNPSTTISFSADTKIKENTTIEIFNSRGQKIKAISSSLYHHEPIEGRDSIKYNINWDGTNKTGKQVPSGVYLYKLVSNGKELSANKMLLLK